MKYQYIESANLSKNAVAIWSSIVADINFAATPTLQSSKLFFQQLNDISNFTFKDANPSASETPNLAQNEKILSNIEKKKFKSELIDSINSDNFEFGFSSKTELLVERRIKENPLLIKEALQELFFDNMDNKKVIYPLLIIISHIDFEDIHPTGTSIASLALLNRDVEICECGIRAFENWGNRTALSYLNSYSELRPDWLENYRKEVVADIERDL